MYRSLGNVELELLDDVSHFVDRIFPNEAGSISMAEYKEAALQNVKFVQSMGLLSDEEKKGGGLLRMHYRHISLGSESWDMCQHLMLGIRKAVGEATALGEAERELKPKDFEYQVDIKMLNSLCIFKDHAPLVFHKLRGVWGIDHRAYMFSLGPEKILGNLLLGNLSALCEVVSTGRSGSLFFKSNEGKFLLKTISPQEEWLAKSFLQEYYQHIVKYPNSLLTRFLGMHTLVKGTGTRFQETRFMIMANIFDTPFQIHEQYDLKGSTIGRHVELPTSGEEEEFSVAMKDLDFHRKLKLGLELKALLLEQLEQDCKFLERHNICDYSLLVGFHFLSPDLALQEPTTKEGSIFSQYHGGIMSLDKTEVYFIGIIDILTTWDFRKRSEKTFKSLFHDANQLSAISPVPYRTRFQKYVASIVD